MEYFFFFLFFCACAGLLLWGMREPVRLYQYPFLMGAIFSAFLIPQAISLMHDPGEVSAEYVDQALLMGSLCMLMAWLGYCLRPMRGYVLGPVRPLSQWRVVLGACVTMVISVLAVLGMLGIPQEEIETGTGFFTILAFFAAFSAIAFPTFLLRFFKQPNLSNLVVALVSGYPIYTAMLFSGRRGQTAEFFIFVALAFYFQRRYVPNRIAALSAIICAAYLIPAFAAIRQEFWPLLLGGSFGEIPFEDSMAKIVEGETLELRNAAAMIGGTLTTGAYGYGTGYWDALVFRYVPGQLLGFDFKTSLQINWVSELDAYDAIGYRHGRGSTFTAIGDTFQQFGYVGSLFFLAQGYLFKNLWLLAAWRNSFIAQIAYIALVPLALVAVTHGSSWFLQGGLIIWLLLYAFQLFARLPSRQLRSMPVSELSNPVGEDRRSIKTGSYARKPPSSRRYR